MKSARLPLVSIITPVYNNAPHLPECIESVLAQTYPNWEYVIVDNRSADESARIAECYAAKDPRIRVCKNRSFMEVVANHNNALGKMSAESRYCKMVFADDWIFPECVERMVALAEEHPSVGIVGAYGLQEEKVMWVGLPYPSRCVAGREICRRLFLDDLYVFGSAHSLLYRAELVRSRAPFFIEGNLHADSEACCALLKVCDFGFIHQVLTFTRERPGSLTAFSFEFNTLMAGRLNELITHGSNYLTPQEFEMCLTRRLNAYYKVLADSLGWRRDSEYWEYHRQKLTEAGIGFDRIRLGKAACARVCNALLNPKRTAEKVWARTKRQRAHRTAGFDGRK